MRQYIDHTEEHISTRKVPISMVKKVLKGATTMGSSYSTNRVTVKKTRDRDGWRQRQGNKTDYGVSYNRSRGHESRWNQNLKVRRFNKVKSVIVRNQLNSDHGRGINRNRDFQGGRRERREEQRRHN